MLLVALLLSILILLSMPKIFAKGSIREGLNDMLSYLQDGVKRNILLHKNKRRGILVLL